jgi:Mg2+ and Co2+ transporter CorA
MAAAGEPVQDDDRRREPVAAAPAGAFAQLFDSRGGHAAIAPDALAGLAIDDAQMLWVDVQGDDEAVLARVRDALGLPAPDFGGISQPAVLDLGESFAVRVVAVRPVNGHGFEGDVLDVQGRANRVLTYHRTPLPFLEALRERDQPQSELGVLSAESFAAVVLDGHLTTYFDAVSGFEAAVERLELEIFDDRHLGSLPELRTLRRGASRLRRMLSPHRAVYGVLSRPDFRPREGRTADRHFGALDLRFERAMDVVENCRDLVMGSFELFSNQTALRTNASMKVLTFATVVLGLLAVTGGILGMNFRAPFFESESGFWYAVGGLVALAATALLVGRWRRWY